MFTKILLAFDGSDGSYKALKTAIELAKQHNSMLCIITVALIPEFAEVRNGYNEEKEKAKKYYSRFLKYASEIAEKSGIKPVTYFEFGKPTEKIVKKANEINADLIVLGVNTEHPLKRRFLGGTGDPVVDYASCSVLVVK